MAQPHFARLPSRSSSSSSSSSLDVSVNSREHSVFGDGVGEEEPRLQLQLFALDPPSVVEHFRNNQTNAKQEDEREDREMSERVTTRIRSPLAPTVVGGSPSTASPSSCDSSNLDSEEEYIRVVAIHGYRFSWRLELRYWLMGLCSGFLWCLLSFWFPRMHIRWRYERESDLTQAEYVCVESVDGSVELLALERISPFPDAYVPRLLGKLWLGPLRITDPLRYPHSYVEPSERMFVFRHHRFFLDTSANPPMFVKQHEPLQEEAGVLAERLQRGLSTQVHADRQKTFGLNQLTIIVPSYPSLLMRELFHPFFIFQIYSVILWCFEEYYIFALCIAVIATVSIVTTLLETHSRLQNLADLAKFEVEVTVMRNDGPGCTPRLLRILSSELVAGDVVEVSTGLLPCDLALLDGGAVVNESMLTGEAIPVVKTTVQMPSEPAGKNRGVLVPLGIEARSTLYAATKVLQLKPSVPGAQVWGMVVRTGFATTKGALILSILYPRPSSFKFVQQSLKFIGCLFCLSLVGFAISVWQLSEHGAPVKTMIIRGLDLITIVVPPSLPLALSVGTNFALLALKAHKIFCISPSRINLAGKIKVMCLDKTGTLTEEGMQLMGVLPAPLDSSGGASVFGPFQHVASGADMPSEGQDVLMHIREEAAQQQEEEQNANGLFGALKELGAGRRERDESAIGLKRMEYGGGGGDISPARAPSSAYALHSSLAPLAAPSAPSVLSSDLLTCLSCCHTLASLDGELIGDPLEVEIFNSTGAKFHEASRDGYVCFISCPRTHLSTASPHASSPSIRNGSMAEWGVRVQFEFVSALQRMSVIVVNQQERSDTRVLVKGSPEVMRPLCKPESIPTDYERMLTQYAHKGYRILAVACKSIDTVPEMEKEELRVWCEQDLTFLGLLVLENKVKPETAPTLSILRSAGIRNIICTGDHPQTGCAVGKECGLVEPGTRLFLSHLRTDAETGLQHIEWIDTDDGVEGGSAGRQPLKLDPVTLTPLTSLPFKYELAVTGAAFKYLEERHLSEETSRRYALGGKGHRPGGDRPYTYDDPVLAAQPNSATNYFHRVILNALVFARMTPDQKSALVGHLQSLGLYTGMCGDGANDAGALKAGDIGVSLSDSEASIAAPFTYQRPNISCLPVLLSEGRSSLMTSFQLFKYMAMYSMIQFTAVILLYFKASVLGNWEYLYQDMFLVFPLTVFMGSTRSSPHLSRKRPSGNLLSLPNIANVLGHMLICLGFQLLVFDLSQQQLDYVAYDNKGGESPCVEDGPCTYEATSLYYYSNFQYVIMALLFARGAPWKASILTNRKFSLWALMGVAVNLALLFSQHQGSFFREEEVSVHLQWRGVMFLLVLLNGLANLLFHVLLFPIMLARYQRWRQGEWRKARVYGRLKPIEGPQAKRYHRLRGEFEDRQGEART